MSEAETNKERILRQLKEAYALLRKDHHLSPEDILRQLEESEIGIPVTAFSKELSGLETITKYLKENQRLELKLIAQKLNRSYRTIWGAYHTTTHKHPSSLAPSPTPYQIPLSLFSQRKLSVLETITHHLKIHYKLRYSEIDRLLHRDPRTIRTTEHKAEGKIK